MKKLVAGGIILSIIISLMFVPTNQTRVFAADKDNSEIKSWNSNSIVLKSNGKFEGQKYIEQGKTSISNWKTQKIDLKSDSITEVHNDSQDLNSGDKFKPELNLTELLTCEPLAASETVNTTPPSIISVNSTPSAIILMKYDSKSFTYSGNGSVNADTQIYKTTRIEWESSFIDSDGDQITNVEWQNKKEYYGSYGEQIVMLRVQDSKGAWSQWTEVKFSITNRPPVASLRYVIMNPSSLVNGNITSDTQIAWLWSYGTENYMYDPDGDPITDISIDGIPSQALLGSLQGNIGFVTKFNDSAQYIMRFKCKDSQGAWSNLWQIIINVEPINGNTRPICIINYSTLESDTRTPIVWGWFNSYDPNQGNVITGVEGTVVKDGEYHSIGEYMTGQDADGCQTLFSQPGEYTVMFRVSDNQGAWSNWISVNVKISKAIPAVISDIAITSVSDNDISYDCWFREAEAKHMMYGVGDPEAFFEMYKVGYQPIPGKVVVNGFSVQGTLKDANGKILSNKSVTASFNVLGKNLSKTSTTDATGKFSISFKGNDIPASFNTTYTSFGSITTNYMEPATLQIVSGDTRVNENIIVNTAYKKYKVMCLHWSYKPRPGSSVYEWVT